MFEPVDIHDIAMASNYSTYHFCRIFRSLVGDSPKEYLRKRRLTIAAERLAIGASSILDIAFSYICSVQVVDLDHVPEGMVSSVIPVHLYAVFRHQGDI